MSRIWQSGFEMGYWRGAMNDDNLPNHGVAKEGTVNSAVLAPSVRAHGEWMLQGPASGGVSKHFLASSEDEIFFRFGYYIHPDIAPGNAEGLLAFASGTTDLTTLTLLTSGKLAVYRGNLGGTQLAVMADALTEGEWHFIEGRLLLANSGGRWVIHVDDPERSSAVIDFTGDTTAGAESTDRWVFFSDNPGASNPAASSGASLEFMFIDDFAMNDTNGSEHNSWVGDGSFVGVVPNAGGDVTQLTRGGPDSGANWSQTDERPLGTGGSNDYTKSSTDAEYDIYNLEDVTNNPQGPITIHLMTQTDTGTDSYKRVLKSGGSEDRSAARASSTNAFYLRNSNQQQDILAVDPTDSKPWTKAKLNALQTGMEVSGTGNERRLLQVVVEVDSEIPTGAAYWGLRAG